MAMIINLVTVTTVETKTGAAREKNRQNTWHNMFSFFFLFSKGKEISALLTQLFFNSDSGFS